MLRCIGDVICFPLCIRIRFIILQEAKQVHKGFIEFYFGNTHGKDRQIYHLEYDFMTKDGRDYAVVSWQTD